MIAAFISTLIVIATIVALIGTIDMFVQLFIKNKNDTDKLN
jgi:hypothetical protein